jgi:hypothetical protein
MIVLEATAHSNHLLLRSNSLHGKTTLNETQFSPRQPNTNSLRSFGGLVCGVENACSIVGGGGATGSPMAGHKQRSSNSWLVWSPPRKIVSFLLH